MKLFDIASASAAAEITALLSLFLRGLWAIRHAEALKGLPMLVVANIAITATARIVGLAHRRHGEGKR